MKRTVNCLTLFYTPYGWISSYYTAKCYEAKEENLIPCLYYICVYIFAENISTPLGGGINQCHLEEKISK
jgi:hypothetical protein